MELSLHVLRASPQAFLVNRERGLHFTAAGLVCMISIINTRKKDRKNERRKETQMDR
jgi:hypothetical protein